MAAGADVAAEHLAVVAVVGLMVVLLVVEEDWLGHGRHRHRHRYGHRGRGWQVGRQGRHRWNVVVDAGDVRAAKAAGPAKELVLGGEHGVRERERERLFAKQQRTGWMGRKAGGGMSVLF